VSANARTFAVEVWNFPTSYDDVNEQLAKMFQQFGIGVRSHKRMRDKSDTAKQCVYLEVDSEESEVK